MSELIDRSAQPETHDKRTETHACDLISRLSEIRSQYNCFNESEEPYYRALSEVIKKLSEQADGDTISRKWLVECVEEGWIKFDTEKDENKFIHLVRDIAPSAQPDLILCKDCRHDNNCAIQYAAQAGNTFFCGAAERREE